MIEEQLEAKIVAALTTATSATAAPVYGFWQAPAAGKTCEINPPAIVVICNLRTPETEGLPMGISATSVQIITTVEGDPKKAKHIAWAKAAAGWLNGVALAGGASALNTSGSYSVQGIEITGTESGYVAEEKAFYTTLNFQVHFTTC